MGNLCGITVSHGDGTRGFFTDNGPIYTRLPPRGNWRPGGKGNCVRPPGGNTAVWWQLCSSVTRTSGIPVSLHRTTEEERIMMEGRAVGQSGYQYRYCQVATSQQVCASGCTADYLRSNNIALAISRWSVQHYEESRRLEGLMELCKEREYPGSACPGNEAADRPGTLHTMYYTLRTTHCAAWHTGGASTSAAAGGGAGEASLYSTHYILRCSAH